MSALRDALQKAGVDAVIGPKIAEGRMTITPAIAGHILSQMNYPKQRRQESGHIAALAEMMRRGQFTAGTQIAFCKLPNGALRLVNGQHRLQAVAQSGLSLEVQIAIIAAADEAEMDRIYYRFDVVQRRRSAEMVVKAAEIAKTLDVQAQIARTLYDAGVIIACGLRRVHGSKLPAALKTPDGRIDAAAPFFTQAKLYNDLIANAERTLKPRLLNGSVMAVALLTLRDQREKAAEFWKGVAENDGLKKGDPRRALVMALTSRDLFTLDAAVLICTNAWNAWYSNKEIGFVKVIPGAEARPRGVKLA